MLDVEEDFYYSVLCGRVTHIKHLLENHPELLNAPIHGYASPLHIAVTQHQYPSLKCLLEYRECDVNIRDENGNGPLHLVYKTNYLKAILSCKRCEINLANDRGDTPLHIAMTRTNERNVAYLLSEKGIDINARNHRGETPLHLGSCFGKTAQVKQLLELGECLINIRDGEGNTMLHSAAKGFSNTATLKFWLKRKCFDINEPNNLGKTPLHQAAVFGNADNLRVLLKQAGCNINARDLKGDTPLHCALTVRNIENVRYLLSRPRIDVNAENSVGNTPLHLAIAMECFQFAYRRFESVHLLLKTEGIDINWQNMQGETPLMVAVKAGEKQLVQILLDIPEIRLDIKDDFGKTVYEYAAGTALEHYLPNLASHLPVRVRDSQHKPL